MFRRILLAGLLSLAPTLALAQAAILQGGPWTPAHAPMYVGPGYSQPIMQDSGPAGGGGIGMGFSELLLAAQGQGTPPYAGQGSGPLGTNFCNYDAPITNATGYHYLCLSANAQGGGLIAYGAGGAASALPMQINVNGTTYAFPGPGTGNVLGPSTSVVGHIVLFNNTTGTLLRDPGIAFPTSTTVNQLLYSSAGNTIAGLASLANGVLVTDGSGVPSLATTVPGSLTYSGVSTFTGKSALSGGVYATIRVSTAAGDVTVVAADNTVVINKGVAEATVVHYTCPAQISNSGFTFTIKDGGGIDATFNITLTPTAGTIDGAATFVMNTSTPGVPPYDSRSVICDASGNSWID